VLVQTVLAEKNVLVEIKNKEKIKQNQRNKLFRNYIFLKIYVIFANNIEIFPSINLVNEKIKKPDGKVNRLI
jgi:transcription antitermination factor NusG